MVWIHHSLSIHGKQSVGDPSLILGSGGRLGNPHQYSCLENPHAQRSLVGYSLWGRRELDMTEQLSHPFTYFFIMIVVNYFLNIYFYVFIWLYQVIVATCGIFGCGLQDLAP